MKICQVSKFNVHDSVFHLPVHELADSEAGVLAGLNSWLLELLVQMTFSKALSKYTYFPNTFHQLFRSCYQVSTSSAELSAIHLLLQVSRGRFPQSKALYWLPMITPIPLNFIAFITLSGSQQ